mgnify:CR=1 FL=1
MGYPSDLLSSRAVVKPGMYAIIPPEGRVFNVIPGIEGCRMTILCTPKMGAGFVQHIGTALPGGGTTVPYGASGQIETFIYVLDGHCRRTHRSHAAGRLCLRARRGGHLLP